MKISDESLDSKKLWVGLWGTRHVVFDPAIQPADPKFVLFYLVEGHALCIREREVERKKVRTVRNFDEINFSLQQYEMWCSTNPGAAKEKLLSTFLAVDTPTAPKKKCLACDGEGVWIDRRDKTTYGVTTEESNIRESCSTCGGKGVVDDVL